MTEVERDQQMGAIESDLESLLALKHTPGWAVYDSFLHLQERTLEQMMVSSKDAHSQSVAVGAWKAVKDLRTWPDRQIELLRAELSGRQSG